MAGRNPAAVPGTFGPRWSSKVGWLLARVIWNTKVFGVSHVPEQGPVIIAGNHTGVIDGPVLLGVAPRRLHIMVKQEMFHGFVGAVLRAAGQIPVDRDQGRVALSTARTILKRGGAVGIFPEGSRGSGQVDQTHGGAAWLALNSGAPVVPVAILGTRRHGESVGVIPGLRRRLVVHFGAPIQIVKQPRQSGKDALATANIQLRDELARHVQEAVREHAIALP